MDPAGVDALRDAIRHLHGCESSWIESVPVTETFNGEAVWTGEVQVFELSAHATAKRAYAWSYATEGTRRKFVAALHAGPVIDALTAVRASIVAASRK